MRLQWRPRFPGEPDHELVWFTVSVTSVIGAAGWLALSLPRPQCFFLAYTGFPCLTCGSTRALIAFLHGDLLGAFRWNPVAFLTFSVLIVYDLYAVTVLVGRTARLRIVGCSAAQAKIIRVIVIAILALNWVYLLAHYDHF
jgi:hypothetical protein